MTRCPSAPHRRSSCSSAVGRPAGKNSKTLKHCYYTLRISRERPRGGDRLRLCPSDPLPACAALTAPDSASATGSRAAPLYGASACCRNAPAPVLRLRNQAERSSDRRQQQQRRWQPRCAAVRRLRLVPQRACAKCSGLLIREGRAQGLRLTPAAALRCCTAPALAAATRLRPLWQSVKG